MNEVRLIFARKNLWHLNLLDEFIQLLFLLLPFLNSKKIVNPLSSVGTQSIYRIFALLLLFFLIIHRFISLSFYNLLFDSSFDLHWDFYIFFSKFNYLVLDFWMHFELSQSWFSHPSVNLLEKNNSLIFSTRFWGSRQKS